MIQNYYFIQPSFPVIFSLFSVIPPLWLDPPLLSQGETRGATRAPPGNLNVSALIEAFTSSPSSHMLLGSCLRWGHTESFRYTTRYVSDLAAPAASESPSLLIPDCIQGFFTGKACPVPSFIPRPTWPPPSYRQSQRAQIPRCLPTPTTTFFR